MKIAHFDYTLECNHTAMTNVAENDTLTAYKQGDKIVCPQCKYQKRRIVDTQKTVSEVT